MIPKLDSDPKTDSVATSAQTSIPAFPHNLSSPVYLTLSKQWPSLSQIQNLTTLFPTLTSPPTSLRLLGHPLLVLTALMVQR